MSLNDETDDSSYVQQAWDGNGFQNEHEIQEILSQFSVNQELRNLQINLFGVSEPVTDPQLQLPSNMGMPSMGPNYNTKDSLLGKRNFKLVDVQPGNNK